MLYEFKHFCPHNIFVSLQTFVFPTFFVSIPTFFVSFQTFLPLPNILEGKKNFFQTLPFPTFFVAFPKFFVFIPTFIFQTFCLPKICLQHVLSPSQYFLSSQHLSLPTFLSSNIFSLFSSKHFCLSPTYFVSIPNIFVFPTFFLLPNIFVFPTFVSNIFVPITFLSLSQHFLSPTFFVSNIFFFQKFFLYPNIFCRHNIFVLFPNICLSNIFCLLPNICLSPNSFCLYHNIFLSSQHDDNHYTTGTSHKTYVYKGKKTD